LVNRLCILLVEQGSGTNIEAVDDRVYICIKSKRMN